MITSLKIFIKYFNNFSSTSISIILMIISGFSFIVMHSAAKYLSDEIHVFEITFLRCLLVIFVLAPLIFKQGLNTFITKQPKLQIYRIITNSIAMLCFFYGLTLTTLSQVTALNLSVPIFTTYSENDYELQKIGNSLLRLILECIIVWASWYNEENKELLFKKHHDKVENSDILI